MALRLCGLSHQPARQHDPGPSRPGPSTGRGRSSGLPLLPHRAGARAAPSAAQGPPLGGHQPVGPRQCPVWAAVASACARERHAEAFSRSCALRGL